MKTWPPLREPQREPQEAPFERWTLITDAFGDGRYERDDGYTVTQAPDGDWVFAEDPEGEGMTIEGETWWATPRAAMKAIDRCTSKMSLLVEKLDWIDG